MITVFIAVALLFGFILYKAEFEPSIIVIMVIILALITSFASLTVSIDEKFLRIKFGYGIFKISFNLDEISSAKIVRNHWYYGWGIRFWFWPRMVIFNVSGFDAVEIKTTKGKIYRIGTDEPERLEDAIVQGMRK